VPSSRASRQNCFKFRGNPGRNGGAPQQDFGQESFGMAASPVPPARQGHPIRPIRRGRLVAGIALHFLAPGYGLVLVGDAALGHAPGTWAAWLPHALGLGGWFLAAYGGAAVLASGLAALTDRRNRARNRAKNRGGAGGDAPDLHVALAAARGRYGADGDAQLDRIAALGAQAGNGPIVADIARLLAASSAAPAPDAALQRHTAQALAILADALDAQVSAQVGQAQDRALVMARYIDLKYRTDHDGKDTL
jgi:hypothetical protein